ncbi:hypothetical protein PR202_ga08236 [Eleusine coracana subsp. coracana]|uniref:CBS domain-containing protein CBSCBSPB3 n=1 Tax=Eleusine coracana subsp. coracana TaxID=191504 RepID=A0AAV5C1P4_ELECO|nr:hypothetical protein PR202_ga08236 [Eleusine coracana subsp. coracana]
MHAGHQTSLDSTVVWCYEGECGRNPIKELRYLLGGSSGQGQGGTLPRRFCPADVKSIDGEGMRCYGHIIQELKARQQDFTSVEFVHEHHDSNGDAHTIARSSHATFNSFFLFLLCLCLALDSNFKPPSSQLASPHPLVEESIMAARSASQPRRRAAPPLPAADGKASTSSSKPTTSPVEASEERTVKKLRLTRALTLPEATTVSEACRRMAARRLDAALLTDTNGMLSGIVTAEDIAGRVISEGLKPEETSVVKVMTRNPVFVMSNTSAIEALQTMVKGKFRHLPIVERGEVIAVLDIAKFLYDAISRMEKAAEQGSAIAAAMEGVERQYGNDFPGPQTFMQSLQERMFKPSLSTIITENSSSKDLVLRVLAHNLSPEISLVEKFADDVSPTCAYYLLDPLSAVSESLDELASAVAYRLGMDNEKWNIKLLYDDEDGDRVVLTNDGDLTAAIQHAKSAGWKVLRLHTDESETMRESTVSLVAPSPKQRRRPSLWFGVAAGAVALTGVSVVVYLKRSQL